MKNFKFTTINDKTFSSVSIHTISMTSRFATYY